MSHLDHVRQMSFAGAGSLRRHPHSVALVIGVILLACCSEQASEPQEPEPLRPGQLPVTGQGAVAERYTAEVSARGNHAYTTTWGRRGGNPGNAVKIWDVRGATPLLVDSLSLPDATTLGDVQVSDDGGLLVVATEFSPGSIAVFDLADPAHPQLLSRFSSAHTGPGVHTAEVARVNGRLYAFLSVDPQPPRLVIVDLGDPRNPREVLAREMGRPFIHDVFVRDGILLTALWDDGLTLWDIGGGAAGGSITNPVALGNVRTTGSAAPGRSLAHNVWWFHDPRTGSRRYAFVGEEGPAALGNSASGDIHVVDVNDLRAPREVAFFHRAGAGTHNFWVDEPSGVLYAAYYNAGVIALDVRGDLSNCVQAARAADGRCDLGLMGRELANGPQAAMPVFMWGVQQVGNRVYASDMLNGLWVLEVTALRR
ncbi:MAG: hypothetical protein HY701_13890 [Gemmatimonadetes bacterium]|nr:hypothetical protein [Gemmatimonadota bacterium]